MKGLTDLFLPLGYGNIVPKTVQGRLFCVFYALLGIPATCLTLKAVGDKIAELFTKLITTFEKRLLKRPHPKHVELKVALTTVVSTMFFLLPFMSLIVKVRRESWTFVESFYFTFITLSTIGFGDFLPHFDKDADYVLVVFAFVGLAFVSSIFCSLNTVLEQYGVSVRVVRSLREKTAAKSSDEKSVADDSELVDGKNKSNGLQDTASAYNSTEDQSNNLQIIGENTQLDLVSLSNRNSLVTEEEVNVDFRKRGSSTISLGIFRC